MFRGNLVLLLLEFSVSKNDKRCKYIASLASLKRTEWTLLHQERNNSILFHVSQCIFSSNDINALMLYCSTMSINSFYSCHHDILTI